jgi:tRNA 2-thiocytidine biosynthesis protein TtcA
MPPKLVSDDGRHIVIRPLAYVEESDLARYAEWREFPIIPCNLCGSQLNMKRREVKQLIRDWDRRFPGRIDNIFASLTRVVPSHLMDASHYDFASLAATGETQTEGDIAFDANPDFEQPAPAIATGADSIPIGIAHRR